MTPAETAQFRIRVLLWWGAGLFVAGIAFRWLVLRAPASGQAEMTEALWVARAALLVVLAGAGVLGVGLVAVGVRLGLTAHGVPGAADAADR